MPTPMFSREGARGNGKVATPMSSVVIVLSLVGVIPSLLEWWWRKRIFFYIYGLLYLYECLPAPMPTKKSRRIATTLFRGRCNEVRVVCTAQ